MPATVKPGPSSSDDIVDSPPSTSSSSDNNIIKASAKQTKVKTSLNVGVDSDAESIAGDDFGSTDEVKVFKDEDEPDCSESYQAELLAEKSSLISESEQSMRSYGHHFPFGDKELHQLGTAAAAAAFAAGSGKYLDPSFGMGYLISPYTAAYANGFGAPHMGRPGSPLPPFFYGDPLSSPPPPPPPAPMGTFLDKVPSGLRSPLYPLSQAQYPYSMIGPDQLAAWHQASMYQSASQRPGSPYSLAMSAASGASAISRFSSFGLLGSGGHLPHGKRDFDGRQGKDSSPLKKKEPHIKKPLNAFMLYMKEMRPVVQAECTLKESAAINQILGRRWHGLSRDEQAKYYEQARLERQKHMQMYPHWNARDNYRYGAKKKKRKRDKSTSGQSTGPVISLEQTNGPNTKKCRALYGVDQHNLWCKPCSPNNNTDLSDTHHLQQLQQQHQQNQGGLSQTPLPQSELSSRSSTSSNSNSSHQHHIHSSHEINGLSHLPPHPLLCYPLPPLTPQKDHSKEDLGGRPIGYPSTPEYISL